MAEREPASALEFLGEQFKRFRLERGWTQEQAGRQLGYSAQHIGHIEQGRRLPQPDLMSRADKLFDAHGVLIGARKLAFDQAAPAEQVADFYEAEARATEIHSYQSHLMPGLLQTEDYARAVVDSHRPSLPPSEVDARVALRMSRRDMLSRPDPPRLWVVIDEAVLYRQVCGAAAMRDQVAHLLESASSHAVTLQVLPFAGPTPAMGVSFNILAFQDEPDMVYLDVLAAGLYHRDKVDAVSRHRVVFDHLREAALSASASLARVEDRLEELE